MTYRGRIKNGLVVLEGPESPPEGAEVTVSVVESLPPTKVPPRRRRFPRSAGIIKDLPPDFSANIDHYLYGAPKRK